MGVEDPKDRGMLWQVPQAKTAETPLHIAKPPSKKETEPRALATELGYSLTPMDVIGKEMATALARHLCHRKGFNLSQTVSYSLPRVEARAERFLDVPGGLLPQ